MSTPIAQPSSYTEAEVTRNNVKCKVKYRIRWLYSRGSFLVLVWNILIIAAVYSQTFYSETLYSGLTTQLNNVVISVPLIALLVCTLLCGWLADARFGKYRVFKTGSIVLFSVEVMLCLCSLVFSNKLVPPVVIVVITRIVLGLGLIGTASCIVTSLQLGLDQMPNASAANITSFISWFVCCFFTGLWVGDASYHLLSNFFDPMSSSYNSFIQIFSLFPVLCMAIVLCTDFFLSPKLLIMEPKSPQSLKLVFRVLKFAAKHKAPVNRSALTYWEEDIPSRIDLGKSKYGGPFTTEQVEDVKTFFKLLVVSFPFVCIVLSLCLLVGHPVYMFSRIIMSPYSSVVLHYFTYNECWCVIIGTLVYEFVIYPFVGNKLPSILRRIGADSFVVIVLSIMSLVVSIVSHYYNTVDPMVWHDIVLQVFSGLSAMVLVSSALEFVCAQSPYNMRTLVTGYAVLLLVSSVLLGSLLRHVSDVNCTGPYCSIILNSITVLLAVIGFLLHCILARWYKRRVRDDIYSPHRLVEEVYDRYLSAQPEIEYS